MFHRPRVQAGLEELSRNHGEVWAKLEAGSEAYFREVDRTTIPFQRILENIALEAKRGPLIIQALFMRLHGQQPPQSEREAFCDRLNEIVAAGGKIKLVQVYTVARKPTESFVTPLSNAEVDALTELVSTRTGLAAEAFYGME
jgi:wyosine [tRNA(Phe)-imidazoG37] synthetase (radical SAM superfamily)